MTAETAAKGVRPANVTVFQGEGAVFNCSGSRVKWLRGEWHAHQLLLAKIFISPDKWSLPKDQQNKFSVTGRYNLIVSDVEARVHGGQYICDTNEHFLMPFANLVVIGNI